LILAGAMGAENGVPCMANDGAAKACVHSLGEALHYEFKPLVGRATVLVRIPNAARRPSSQSAGGDSQAAPTKLLKDLDFLGEAKPGKAFSSFLPSHWYPLDTSF
jgi:hypothetical protein